MKDVANFGSLVAAAVLVAASTSSAVMAQPKSYGIPPCNVGDNRQPGEDMCLEQDKEIDAVIFKVVTQDGVSEPDMGFFVCTCGNADLEVVEDARPVEGVLEATKQTAVIIPSINPKCPIIIGGLKVLVTCTVE
jgi:hypothetical protein